MGVLSITVRVFVCIVIMLQTNNNTYIVFLLLSFRFLNLLFSFSFSLSLSRFGVSFCFSGLPFIICFLISVDKYINKQFHRFAIFRWTLPIVI